MNEKRTFRLASALTDEEDKILNGWGTDIWGNSAINLTWREKDYHLLCYADGKLVAKSSFLIHTIGVGDARIQVAGAGGVVCVPEAQRHGHASATIKELIELLRKKSQFQFALGICRPPLVPFYERLGWQLLEVPVLIEQQGHKIPCPLLCVVIPLRDEQWPSGVVDLFSEPW
jgi:GNAT superfamily N-acetyltransferase